MIPLLKYLKRKSTEILRDKETGNITGFKFDNNIDKYLGVFNAGVIMQNMVELCNSVSEIFFPVSSIATRVANGNFQLKDSKTDGIIYDNEKINKFLSNPNPLYTFKELVRMMMFYKLVCGYSYLYGDTGFGALSGSRWKYCDTYSVLPSQHVEMVLQHSPKIFTAENISEIIKNYKLKHGQQSMIIEPHSVMSIKDVSLKFDNSYIQGSSRLKEKKYPVCNLIASYEARNAIYVKRGALGALVSKKADDSGSVALTKTEKENIQKDYYDTYGMTNGKSPIMISELPIEFLRFNMSIEELKPFDESLEDAIQIAGIFEVPPDLIPRRDKSTFSNQNNSEIGFYSNVIIPHANMLVQALNKFLGLEKDGMYLDVDFKHIPVLQSDKKMEAETEKTLTEACKTNFWSSVITLNDWIAKLGGERVDNPIFNKYILSMTPDEVGRIRMITKELNLVQPEILKTLSINEKRELIGYKKITDTDSQDVLLAEKLGVGGTQAMIAVMTDAVMTPEQKSEALQQLFNRTKEEAERLSGMNNINQQQNGTNI